MDECELSFQLLGDRALTLRPSPCDALAQRQLHWLAEQLRQWQGVDDMVAGMGNLTLYASKPHFNLQALSRPIIKLWQQRPGQFAPGRHHRIEVAFGGDRGPDLPFVARHCGMSETEVIRRLCGATLEVACLGFMPGFAYLSGSPFMLPRKAEPRLSVPPGSLALAGNQAGIYPCKSPGGWQLLGQTQMSFFDVDAQPPASLQPGDTITLVAR